MLLFGDNLEETTAYETHVYEVKSYLLFKLIILNSNRITWT